MACYLVGKNGFLKKTWGFIQAIEAAGDGDTIELEEGFSPFYEQNNKHITITKSITIEGHQDNIIDKVFVQNGAAVTLKNLEVRNAVEKHNSINVKDGAVLTAENVIFTSYVEKGENYPVVYIGNGSKVSLVNSVVKPCSLHDGKYQLYAENAALEINNSIIHAKVGISHSRLDMQNSSILYPESYALYAYGDSVVTLSASTLEGGCQTEKATYSCVSCVRLVDSKLTAYDVIVKQPEYYAALCAVRSSLTLNIGRYDSLQMEKSEADIGIICVVESAFIYDNSHVKAEGLCIVGKWNGKINLCLNKKSSLEADIVCFGQLTQPNIKAERDTTINAEAMIQAAYDAETWEFIVDEQVGLKETGDASEIAYFGELSAFEKLNQMVGIASVKQKVEEFVAIAEANKRREQRGIKNEAFSLHSMFVGNPGTGKTTVARLLGKILYEKGVISSDNFVETSRSGLVGRYIGETGQKTREVLESALGGVLFIDEAYTLWAGNDNSRDFGHEAIEEILKFMEDRRQDIVLIFAGYTHSMEKWLESNDGLPSRIPHTFVFEDYTQEELIRIGLDELHRQGFEIDEKAYADLVYRQYAQSNDNSNGRWVRNLNEKLKLKQAVRLSKEPNADDLLLTQADIDAVL